MKMKWKKILLFGSFDSYAAVFAYLGSSMLAWLSYTWYLSKSRLSYLFKQKTEEKLELLLLLPKHG